MKRDLDHVAPGLKRVALKPGGQRRGGAEVSGEVGGDGNLVRVESLCRGAPGARAEEGTDVTHTQPVHAALMAGKFVVHIAEGDVYSVEDQRGWLGNEWTCIDHRPLVGAAERGRAPGGLTRPTRPLRRTTASDRRSARHARPETHRQRTQAGARRKTRTTDHPHIGMSARVGCSAR